MFAAFLGALGTLEGIDLFPAGEVDRANAALGQQSVDGFGVAVGCHTATFSGLGQILEHVGHDGQRIGFGGTDQTHWAALGPTGGIQPFAHVAAVGIGGDAAVAVRVGQVRTLRIVGDAGGFGGPVADGMVDGPDRVVRELAGAAHPAIGAGLGTFHADGLDLAVLAENLGGGGVEVHVIPAVGRIAFEVDVAIVLHVFGHLADGEQFLDHLTGELVLAGHLDGLVVQVKVVFVDDELHAGQLLHLAQFLHAELGLSHATADEQVEHLGLVLADALVHVVRNVGLGLEVVGVTHEFAGHIHGHVATADHGDVLGRKRPFAGTGGVTVVPFDELGGAVHAFKIGAGQVQRLVLDRAGGEQHGVVTGQQVVEGHVLAEFHIAVQVDIRVVERLLKRGGDELDGRVVRGHTVTHQAERHGQLLEQVDARFGAEAELFAQLLELAQEDVGGIDAGRPGADYSNAEFSIHGFSHAL